MEEGSELSRMMSAAASIKGEQVKQDRKGFEAAPPFVQHTLFHKDPEMLHLRQLPFAQRLVGATSLKDVGNKYFVAKQYTEGIAMYERALGCFSYFVSTDPDWQKNGIKDENLKLERYAPKSEEEQTQLMALMVSCVNNVSACQLSMKDYISCIQSCSLVLQIQPANAKALYRRAMARVAPASCGGAELEMAIQDLMGAVRAEPTNGKAKKELLKLIELRNKQKKADKGTFAGMFDRGEVVQEKEVSEQKIAKRREAETEMERRMETVEALMQNARKQNKPEEAHELAVTLEGMVQAKARLHEEKPIAGDGPKDFRNPNKDMVEDAKRFGLDLGDPRIVAELERLEREKLKKGYTGGKRGDKGDGKGDASEGGIDASEFSPTPRKGMFVKNRTVLLGAQILGLLLFGAFVLLYVRSGMPQDVDVGKSEL